LHFQPTTNEKKENKENQKRKKSKIEIFIFNFLFFFQIQSKVPKKFFWQIKKLKKKKFFFLFFLFFLFVASKIITQQSLYGTTIFKIKRMWIFIKGIYLIHAFFNLMFTTIKNFLHWMAQLQ